MLSLNLNWNLPHIIIIIIIIIVIIIIIIIIIIILLWRVPRGTPYDGLYGKTPPEKGLPPSEEFITKFTSLLIPYTCNINYWAFIMSEFFMAFGWDMRIFRRKSVVDDVVFGFFYFFNFFRHSHLWAIQVCNKCK